MKTDVFLELTDFEKFKDLIIIHLLISSEQTLK